MSAYTSPPVLFLIFNRPSKTKIVFDAIRKAHPSKLYIAADGPRDHVLDEQAKCEETRQIVSNIDWECEVKLLFREKNLGCGRGVADAITWFFEQEEAGIILEDDCVPCQDFFPFCAEMLEKYRSDTRVWLISGTNVMTKWESGDNSYFFSKIGGIWGWASWRRAWKDYDLELKLWKDSRVKELFLQKYLPTFTNGFANYDKIANGDIFTWDYQFGFLRLLNNGLSVVPCNNLITNIGFDSEATHTVSKGKMSNLSTLEISFPLSHPSFVLEDTNYDQQHLAGQKKKFKIVRKVLKWVLPNFMFERIQTLLARVNIK